MERISHTQCTEKPIQTNCHISPLPTVKTTTQEMQQDKAFSNPREDQRKIATRENEKN